MVQDFIKEILRLNMKKVLIKGYYGYENLGDDFILYTLLDTLSSVGKFDVTVVSAGDKYTELFNGFPNLNCSVMTKKWRKFSKIKELIRNDYWIIGGGGLFPSESSADFNSLLSEIKLARFFHTKVCIYGIDINSITKKENKKIWKEISQCVEFIVCRNRRTYNLLKEIDCKNIIKSSDITFSVETPIEKENNTECLKKINCEQQKYILWAIPMPWFNNEYKEEVHGERYKKLVTDIQKAANQECNKELKHVFLPFYYDMDMKIISDIVKGIDGEYVICDKAKELTIEEKRQLFKFAKACVSMRFHGVMFSLYHQTPVAIISYSNKTSDVIKEYGLQGDLIEYGIRPNADFYSEFDLQSDKLNQIISTIVMNKTQTDYATISAKLKENAVQAKKILQDWLK